MNRLFSPLHDSVTPDGYLSSSLKKQSEHSAEGVVTIESVPQRFLGFDNLENTYFNIKSSLAQIGLDGKQLEIDADPTKGLILVRVLFTAYGKYAEKMLNLLDRGTYVGKMFCADSRRRVLTTYYLERMLNQTDREGNPLLKLGCDNGRNTEFAVIDGRLIAWIYFKKGILNYKEEIGGFIPFLHLALKEGLSVRKFLKLYRIFKDNELRIPCDRNILLLESAPLHIRTVFGRVASDLLPFGLHHTSADILQPDTENSGEIYEFFGYGSRELERVPLEFYTIEPYREHVFFDYRDLLKENLENPKTLTDVFKTVPPNKDKAAIFIVKGSQIQTLSSEDWITSPLSDYRELNDHLYSDKNSSYIESYIKQQPCYPFLEAMEKGLITSQGVLMTKYFPSTLLKGMLLSHYVRPSLMQIYFNIPSCTHDHYFSQRDRSLLSDLYTFGIPVFWVNTEENQILRYVKRTGKQTGMFVPIERCEEFKQATFFGVYGSNLSSMNSENELRKLFSKLLETKSSFHHPLFNETTPLALVTGGGPGAMEIGNKVARELNILSCGNIIELEDKSPVAPQPSNRFIDARMSYRLDNLIERQEHFYLDFPIFVMGGIGTDFEFSLEEVSLKVGRRHYAPILLLGSKDYWKSKITSRYLCNIKNGMIKGSEWISNCFFCVENAEEAFEVYEKFFKDLLPIGPHGPVYKNGFVKI